MSELSAALLSFSQWCLTLIPRLTVLEAELHWQSVRVTWNCKTVWLRLFEWIFSGYIRSPAAAPEALFPPSFKNLPLTDRITRERLRAPSVRSHLASTCVSSDLLCSTPPLCMQINTTDISACKDQNPAGSVYLLEAAALKQTKKNKEKKVEELSGQINLQLTKMLEAFLCGLF